MNPVSQAETLKLLIIEDSEEDTDLLVMELKRGGFSPLYQRVDTAASMAAALDQGPWDVIISDYSMPRFTLAEALAMLKARQMDVPFLVVSATIVDEQAVAAMKAGAHDFVMKDRLARLAPAIRREIRECQVRQERKSLEEQMQQSQRLESLGLLAGGVAHDFNNLLAVILNYARFAEPEIHDAEVREDVRQIRLAATRAAELTKQLLAFSRREVIHPRVIEPNKLVADLEKLLRRTLGEDIELTTGFAAGLPPVKADPTKLEQVLLNLAVNARDAMPNGGTLRVETSAVDLEGAAAEAEGLAPGLYVVLAVTDSGCGMSPEVAAHVFEPFFTTKERGKGTGLGLATVYGIVKQAGGGIALQSERGVGTAFRVFLPASAEEADSDGTSVAPAGGRETILVAEDEPAVRELTRRILQTAGYSVLTAGSGDEALAVAAANGGPIQLLLTDLVMPGMSGKQLAQRFRTERPDCRVLYMSGYFDDVVAEKGVFRAEVAFLAKPFSREDLLGRIRAVLADAIAA
jgi:two-component system, cell cycle sensor histidine kinase and response regulator CckA